MTKKPHKHAEAIHAYADGAEIQIFDESDNCWVNMDYPTWLTSKKYRIKPEDKVVKYWHNQSTNHFQPCQNNNHCQEIHLIQVTFEGQSYKMKEIKLL